MRLKKKVRKFLEAYVFTILCLLCCINDVSLTGSVIAIVLLISMMCALYLLDKY